MADRVADPWGLRTPYAAGAECPARMDPHLLDGPPIDEVDTSAPLGKGSSG